MRVFYNLTVSKQGKLTPDLIHRLPSETHLYTVFQLVLYTNFFTNHFLVDFRIPIVLALVFLYRKAWATLFLRDTRIRIPMLLGFFLAAFFIYLAENMGTLLGAWRYPNQSVFWQPVGIAKLSSWLLLFVLSFVLILELKRIKNAKEV